MWRWSSPRASPGNAEASEAFDKAIQAAVDAYHALLEAGVPAEDARYLLPNAAESKIVITMNVRELLHFFSLRCCNRAQWEIRDMAHRMLELARPHGSVHLRRRRRAVRARYVPGGQDDLR